MPADTELLTRAQADELIKKAIAKALNQKEILNKEDIIEKLQALPAQTERKFEKTIVSYAMNWDDSIFYVKHEDETGKVTYTNGILFEIIDQIQQPDVSAEKREQAFAAFCIAENYARRSENRSDLEELTKTYGGYFKDEKFTLHLAVCEKIKALKGLNYDKTRIYY